jgi:predicted CXXCH cytochrome family protein
MRFIAAILLMLLTALFSGSQLNAKEDTSDIHLRSTCVDAECHPEFKESKYEHSPVILNKCDACHETIENRHVFKMVSTGEALCVFCHKLNLKSFIHDPVAKGKCIECHNPHGSDFPYLLKTDPSKDLCFQCHDKKSEKILDNKYTHAPAAQGACILCHYGHSAWNKNLLIDEGNDLCIFCHNKEFEPLLKMRHVHKPVTENCQKCHDPHGSNNKMLLSEDEPEFCYECHKEIAEIIKSSSNVHKATTMEESCSNCHAPHASSLPKLLKKPMIDVCLSCHNKEIELPDGKKLQNIAEIMKDNPFKHGPIQQNNCIACHNPHASNIFRLLVSFFPPEFYAPFNLEEYNLCFQCHPKDTFLDERTTALTNFRDGDINLHYMHVNKTEKGRTCRACHEVHASSQKAHVRSSVPYGNWEFPIVFKATPEGGTCEAGCHDEKKYSRKYKKIDSIKPESSKNGNN